MRGRRGRGRWLERIRKCGQLCLLGLASYSIPFSTAEPGPLDVPPPTLPAGHPERIPDQPPSAAEIELWSRLDG